MPDELDVELPDQEFRQHVGYRPDNPEPDEFPPGSLHLAPLERPELVSGETEQAAAGAAEQVGCFGRQPCEMDQQSVDGEVRDGAASANGHILFDLFDPGHEP